MSDLIDRKKRLNKKHGRKAERGDTYLSLEYFSGSWTTFLYIGKDEHGSAILAECERYPSLKIANKDFEKIVNKHNLKEAD